MLKPARLYYAPATCSLATHIALREAGLPVDLIRVDLATHRLADGSDYHAVSPRGYVPVLELEDGSRHTEGAALLQYVGDLDPSGALIPRPGTAERFEVLKWLTFVSSELHRFFSPWLWHKETADSTRTEVKQKLTGRFAELDAHFAKNDYLAGRFSVADAYAYAILNWANILHLDLKPFAHLRAYLDRIAARPKVREALVAEGLVKA